MDNLILGVVAALSALILAPAIVAGGGFIIAIALIVALVAVAIAGPEAWDLYKQIRMGERSGITGRDVIQGRGYDPNKEDR